MRLRGNNERDYFLRFNQTQEMGHIAGLTNVVSFFPMSGPSVQGMMEAITASRATAKPAVEVLARTMATPENAARNLAREIFRALGSEPGAFNPISTSTERASGIQGGHITLFRPRGLDQPDNALYDTTFGFVTEGGRPVLDTFTHNSARLLLPHRQKISSAQLAVPTF